MNLAHPTNYSFQQDREKSKFEKEPKLFAEIEENFRRIFNRLVIEFAVVEIRFNESRLQNKTIISLHEINFDESLKSVSRTWLSLSI